jgi:hypothetical protein
MKQNRTICNIFTIGLASLLLSGLTQCSLLQGNLLQKNCCGYNGPIVSKEAIALYAQNHFISKETIEEWTSRFDTYKNKLSNDSLRSLVNEMGSSYSYNGYYVSLILCNERSIGIQILPGLDEQYKLHFILVGINPDYSRLYIPKPTDDKGLPSSRKGVWNTNRVDGDLSTANAGTVGGLQFSQRP